MYIIHRYTKLSKSIFLLLFYKKLGISKIMIIFFIPVVTSPAGAVAVNVGSDTFKVPSSLKTPGGQAILVQAKLVPSFEHVHVLHSLLKIAFDSQSVIFPSAIK